MATATGSTKTAGRGRPRPKHVPQRMCVSCRERNAKRTLVRVVRTPEGAVELDPSGRRNGRGAYLCDRPVCWERALKSGALGKSLNTTIGAETADELRRHAATLRPAAATDEAVGQEGAS